MEVSAVVIKKQGLLTGFVVGAIGCLFTWMFLGNPPPLGDYFPFLEYLCILLHLHIHLILLALNPPSYLENLFFYALVFNQWFFIGRFGWWILKKIKDKSQNI